MTFDIASLTFDARGLIPAIAQDRYATGEVLMMAWSTAESLAKTLEEGRVTYWSRSRECTLNKGDTSGHIQRLVERPWIATAIACCCWSTALACSPHQPAVVFANGGPRGRRGRDPLKPMV